MSDAMITALGEIQRTINHIESDLVSDRTSIDMMKEQLSVIEAKVEKLYSRLPRLEDKQKDAAAEVVQPVIDAVDNLNKTIKSKKGYHSI